VNRFNFMVSAGVLPVGHAVEDMVVLILDEQGREVGPGQSGQIVDAGRHISPGYWSRPDLTSERFIPYCPTTGTPAHREAKWSVPNGTDLSQKNRHSGRDEVETRNPDSLNAAYSGFPPSRE
jgi:hypothetical protein